MFTNTLWATPFVGLILSMAFLPLVCPAFWQRHYGFVSCFWVSCFLVPAWILQGGGATIHAVMEILVNHYLSFIILIGSLFVMARNIRIIVNPQTTPLINTLFLAISGLIASVLGTTGASMILIHPFLEMNRGRGTQHHLVVFFIFIVANIGGCLTPVGDPPLFLGYLMGVHFFWTTQHLFLPFATLMGLLLIVFYFMDRTHYTKYPAAQLASLGKFSLQITGIPHLLAMVLAVIVIVFTGSLDTLLLPNSLAITQGDLVRNSALILLALGSWLLATFPKDRNSALNSQQETWHPIIEVIKLFAALFVTVFPVIEMLKKGESGPFSDLVAWMMPMGEPSPSLFFWVTGALSSVLDNAPTYLIFFNLAGGKASLLMTQLAPTLTAISLGAVFMGAMTYIGNAPNLMVKSIAEEKGIVMPSFLVYIGWSFFILLPSFAIIHLIFLR